MSTQCRSPFLLLSLLFLTTVYAQPNIQQTSATRASATSMVTLSSGGAASALDNQLQAAADEAEKALEENPNDLETVLQTLATALVNAITNSVVTVLNDDDFNPTDVARNISNSVELAFGSITNSNTAFADLDLDTVTSDIQTSVEGILSRPDATTEITETTKQVAEAVLGAIGKAFAQISGNQFQFTSTVEVTTSSQQASTSAVASGSAQATATLTSNATTAQDALERLTAGDVKGTVTIIIQLADQTPALATFFVSAASNPALSTVLVNVFTQLFANGSIAERQLVEALGQTYTQAGGQNITSVLGQAMALANASGNYDGLILIINYAITQVGPQLDVIIDSIKYAINQDGCKSVSIILQAAKTAVDQQNLGALWSSVMNQVPEIRECLQQSIQIEVSANIVSSLSDTEQAFTLIQSSAEQGQTVAIANAFIQALSTGQEEDLKQVLGKFLQSSDIPPSTVSIIVTLTIRQGGREAVQTFLDTITELTDLNQLVMSFSYALTSGDQDLVDTISTLIRSSIQGDECGLEVVMDSIFAEVTAAQSEQISQLLRSIDAEQCLPKSLQGDIQVAPVEEPMVRTPAPSPAPEPPVIEIPFPQIPYPSPNPTPLPNNGQQLVSPVIPQPVVIPSPLPSPVLPSPTPTPAPRPTPAPEASPTPQGTCTDVVPPGGYTCEQQAEFGKCERKWMRDGGFCAKTCKFCSDTCFDIPPDSAYSCIDQKSFGKCSASWMIEGGYCRFTCGLCDDQAAAPTPITQGIGQQGPSQAGFGQTQNALGVQNCPPVQDTCVQCCECPATQHGSDEHTRMIVRETVAEVMKSIEK